MLVSRDDIEALSAFLNQRYQQLAFSARCADGSVLTTDKAAELLEFDNRNDRRIHGLTIEFRQKDFAERGDIEIRDKGDERCSWTVCSNDDSRAQQVALELGQRIRACRPWYSWISRTRPWLVIVGFLLLFFVIIEWQQFLRSGNFTSTGKPVPESGEVFLIALPILLLLGGLIFLLELLWSWLFPKVWFLIGRQKREMEKRERVRRWVFGSVIGATLLGIIINYISAIFLAPHK